MYITYLRLEVMSISPFGIPKIIFSEDFKLVFKDFGIMALRRSYIPFFYTFCQLFTLDFFHPTTHIKLLNLIAFYIGLIFYILLLLLFSR